MVGRSEPTKHVVVIVPDEEFCDAAPRDILCLGGDLICFQNLTAGGVVIVFDNTELFGMPSLHLDLHGMRALPVVGSVVGCYTYQAFAEGNQGQSKKTLKPRIIVYRPMY